ncbi:MAG: insulinase family protein [Campylobacterales bacterium]|nr:insulinase family protein [Campylobacterales bacterium]
MNRIKTIVFVILCLVTTLTGKDLPVEPSLVTGELKNGLKYTIKKNSKPQDKASFRLLVEAGSLEEDDDQKGIAHLVEHLAFNGTENFPGNDLITFLESMGVGFGNHLNASTSTTRTLYKLEVPLKDDNLEKAMLVFKDWAGGVVITQKELDKERGVVLEEARSRNNVRFRMFLQAQDVYYANSKYLDRTPIGDMDIVKNISLKRVKAFYDDWYRPELMHFVIAGDFDVGKIEKLIIKTFKDLKNKSSRKQASREVPLVNKTRVVVARDKELTKYSTGISFYKEAYKTKTEADYKKDLIYKIIPKLFNIKGNEQTIKRNPAAKSIGMRLGYLGTNLLSFNFGSSFTGSNEIKALEELTSLIYSIEKYGFDKGDFKRTIKKMKKANQDSLKALKNKTSNRYVDEIVNIAHVDEIFIDEKYKIKLKERLLSEITLKDVNKAYRDILKSKSRIITYQLPESKDVSKRRVKKILANGKKRVKKQKISKDLPDRIVDLKKLKPSKIVKENYNKKYDFYEFTLKNGIKVAYKFNNYKKNKVYINAFSKGGFSLYDTKDLANAKFAVKIIGKSGYDNYNILDYKKIYNDKSISFNSSLSRYGESLGGTTTTKDFQYFLETIYLFTTKYQFDDNIFENTKHITLANLKKQNRIPTRKFSKELNAYRYSNDERFVEYDKHDVKALDKKRMLEIYKDRFSDLNNFTFIVVGDIEKDEVKKYITKFLGNLPVTKRDETYNFRGNKQVQGEHKFIRFYNNENISDISLSYIKEAKYSTMEAIRLSAFTDVLKTKLRELIREEKSGVYGIRVGSNFIRVPYEHAALDITFSCDPARKDELVKYLKEEIKNIKTNTVDKKYVNAYVKKRLVNLKEAKKKGKFWMGQLKKHYYYGDNLNRIDNFEKMIRSITPKDIKNTANKYLETKNIIYTELNPKNMK